MADVHCANLTVRHVSTMTAAVIPVSCTPRTVVAYSTPGPFSMRSAARATIALIPVLCVLACSRDERAQPATAPFAKPAALTVSENLAEDIQDDINTQGWRTADGKLADLLAEVDGVSRSVTDDARAGLAGDYRAILDSLMARVARRDRLGSLVAANDLCRQLASVASGYPARAPVTVTLLDVSGRDLLYRSEAGLWTAAAASVAEYRQGYGTVRSHVSERDPALDGRVGRDLDEAERTVQARDTAGVRKSANALLDDVDRIEQTY